MAKLKNETVVKRVVEYMRAHKFNSAIKLNVLISKANFMMISKILYPTIPPRVLLALYEYIKGKITLDQLLDIDLLYCTME